MCKNDIHAIFADFTLQGKRCTKIAEIKIGHISFTKYTNEFWTAKQRQACSLHEISYRACFKPQLPEFFIDRLTKEGDAVYDPFAGRGTTAIEAGLLGRNVISNDINPLSGILCRPRFFPPALDEIKKRLYEIKYDPKAKADIDLSMFFHPKTEAEIVSLRGYLERRRKTGKEDDTDRWIRMTATNRLTGHAKGFFSIYTLPPNQAVSPKRQIIINKRLRQKAEYKNTREIILKKSLQLLKGISAENAENLKKAGERAVFLSKDARHVPEITADSVTLTVTSPPFLDVVQYANDNWLRCWFNRIDADSVSEKITMARDIGEWGKFIGQVFTELYRITRKGGWAAFEVGEVRGGKIKLDEHVLPLGIAAGFEVSALMVNSQKFTKTANIWGVKNNSLGTNTNRILLFRKP